MYETLSLVVWKPPFHVSWEFILYAGDDTIAYREGNYPSRASAKRAGMKRADALLAPSLFS